MKIGRTSYDFKNGQIRPISTGNAKSYSLGMTEDVKTCLKPNIGFINNQTLKNHRRRRFAKILKHTSIDVSSWP
jgi:hypothetical protein